jgi:hypothetical protein
MWSEQACSVSSAALSLTSILIPHLYPPCSSLIVSPPISFHSHSSFPLYRALLSLLTLCLTAATPEFLSPKVIQIDREESPPSVTRLVCPARSSMAPLPLMAWQESWKRYTPSPSSGLISDSCGKAQVCAYAMRRAAHKPSSSLGAPPHASPEPREAKRASLREKRRWSDNR